MTSLLGKYLATARDAILTGDPGWAIAEIERFMTEAEISPPAPEDRDELRQYVTELQLLAQASLRGAKDAADRLRTIIETASSFQSYDAGGQRLTTSIVANSARRF